MVLKNFAPCTQAIGLHFSAYDHFIHTPVIRSEIREMKIENKGHYTVYLPAYSDKAIEEVLSKFPKVEWQVFSKHLTNHQGSSNVHFYPISNSQFNKSLSSASGILCGAGFEAPAEAMFLGKKLLVVPMEGQYEQQCNAAAIAQEGFKAIQQFNVDQMFAIEELLDSAMPERRNFPLHSDELAQKALAYAL